MAKRMHALVADPEVVFRGRAAAKKFTLHVACDVEEAAPFWDALAATDEGSVYQSRRFLGPWIRHVAPGLGIKPRLGLVSDGDGRPVALLPFGLVRRGPLHAITYLGGRDSNLNMPLIARGAVLSIEEMHHLLRLFASSIRPRADVFILTNNVQRWNNVTNPLAFPGSSPSPSNAFAATIGHDASAFLAARESRDAQKKLRNKMARLTKLGPVGFGRASAGDAPGLIEMLLAQKHAQLVERGVDPGFEKKTAVSFLAELAVQPAASPALDVYVLRVGDAPIALFAGLPDQTHWHGLTTSYTNDPVIARSSPGDLLLRHIVGDLVQRGIVTFDLGVGEARYKGLFCDETLELVDTIYAITPLGRLYAAGESLRLGAKRRIKQTPWALAAARRVQRLLAGR